MGLTAGSTITTGVTRSPRRAAGIGGDVLAVESSLSGPAGFLLANSAPARGSATPPTRVGHQFQGLIHRAEQERAMPLAEGSEGAHLMIEHRVGVTTQHEVWLKRTGLRKFATRRSRPANS